MFVTYMECQAPKDQSTAHDAQPSQEHVHEKTPDSPYPAPQVKMPSMPQESPNYPQTTQHTPSQDHRMQGPLRTVMAMNEHRETQTKNYRSITNITKARPTAQSPAEPTGH